MGKRFLGIVAAAVLVLPGPGARPARGETRWGEGPVYVAMGLPVVRDNERFSRAVEDGQGGAFIVWAAPDPLAPSPLRVWGQKLDAAGARLWNDEGPLLLALEEGADLGNLFAAGDGQGGLWVAYQRLGGPEPREGPTRVMRFGPSGLPVWPRPVAAFDRPGHGVLVPTSQGGAAALWAVRGEGEEILTFLRLGKDGEVLDRRELYRTPYGTSLLASNLGWPGSEPGEALFLLADRHEGRQPRVFAVRARDGAEPEVLPVSSGGPAGLFPDGPCSRYLTAAPAEGGGFYAAWVEDSEGGPLVRLTRLDAGGRRRGGWPEGGIVVDGDPKSLKFALQARPDGRGGVLLQYAARPAGPCFPGEGPSGPKSPASSGPTWCSEGRRFLSEEATPEAYQADLWLSRFGPEGRPAFSTRVARGVTQDQHDILGDQGSYYSAWVDEATRDVRVQRTDPEGRTRFGRGLPVGSYRGRGSLGITALPARGDGVLVAWKQSETIFAQSLGPGVRPAAPSGVEATPAGPGRVLWTWRPGDPVSSLRVLSVRSGEVLADGLAPGTSHLLQVDPPEGEKVVVEAVFEGRSLRSSPAEAP